MNKKSLVKFRHNNNVGLFHYVIFEGDFVVLSEKETGKVLYIKENGKLEITFDVETENYDMLTVELVEDTNYVEKVYNYMIETNNPYFHEGVEGLVALKFRK